jgi:hypothetical protein
LIAERVHRTSVYGIPVHDGWWPVVRARKRLMAGYRFPPDPPDPPDPGASASSAEAYRAEHKRGQ